MIGIYCIATGVYKSYVNRFLSNLNKLHEKEYKEVILFTDDNLDLSEFDNFFNIKQVIISNTPWPIVALLKMWYINKYRGNYDFIYYFDIDTYLLEDLSNLLNNNKLILPHHFIYYGGVISDGHNFLNPEDDNPKSLSYIGLHNYTYAQSGFFMGPADLVYKMCKDVSEWVEADLKRCVIPKWHDESYLNKWKTLHEDLCEVVDIWGKYVFLYEHEDLLSK